MLSGYDGHADAELCGPSTCIRFETKITSGALDLDEDQVPSAHLESGWSGTPHRPSKVLVLLTPDDSSSGYIKGFLSSKCIKSFHSKHKDHKVIHLEWKNVYHHLKKSVANLHGVGVHPARVAILRTNPRAHFSARLRRHHTKIPFGLGMSREFTPRKPIGATDIWMR